MNEGPFVHLSNASTQQECIEHSHQRKLFPQFGNFMSVSPSHTIFLPITICKDQFFYVSDFFGPKKIRDIKKLILTDSDR